MRYLRNTHNIQIQGSTQKKKLKNIGYYHGFKGYRFIKNPNNSINYTDFNEIVALNKFDMDLKSLLYPKIMFLETALKKGLEIDTSIPNVTFDTIVDYIILIVYLLKNINTTKTELNKFVSDFENILNNFKPSVPANVYSRIIYTNTRPKLNLLKNYIKS